jgi:Predicted glutathione S-transferase
MRHYYVSHDDVNPKRLVPTGPDIDFSTPHNRDRLPADLPDTLQSETTAAVADD